MKAVVIGEGSGASMETIMSVYPRHKAVVDRFVARGEVIGIGPFADRGNMAIFRTRAAAEEFVKEDPFILEGLIKPFGIRDWNDSRLTSRTGRGVTRRLGRRLARASHSSKIWRRERELCGSSSDLSVFAAASRSSGHSDSASLPNGRRQDPAT